MSMSMLMLNRIRISGDGGAGSSTGSISAYTITLAVTDTPSLHLLIPLLCCLSHHMYEGIRGQLSDDGHLQRTLSVCLRTSVTDSNHAATTD
jgi:hypothetical protein